MGASMQEEDTFNLMDALSELQSDPNGGKFYIYLNENIGLVQAIMDTRIDRPVLLLPVKLEKKNDK